MPKSLGKLVICWMQQAKSILPTLATLGVLAGGWWAVHQLTSESHSALSDSDASLERSAIDSADSRIVSLPPAKLAAARLESLSAQPQILEHVHVIPGRLRYDETKHVAIKAPLAGIVQEFAGTPGERVEQGQLLAVLRSPEIGQARAEVVKRRQEREIARQLVERENLVADSLKKLLAAVQSEASGPLPEFQGDQQLGNYRQEILGAHAKLKLAQQLLSKVQPLGDSGAIAGRTIRERETELQIAQSVFQTACDQALFNATQSKLTAEAKLAEADRQVNLALQTVDELLGYQADRSSLDFADENTLSRLEIRAPFAGTIESRQFANNERVTRDDWLVVLADTRLLYVAASIREMDWPAIDLKPGTMVKVEIPALENRKFDASVRFVGREMLSESNSIPLVASIDNYEGLLRPGMFVRVTIPIGRPVEGLSVKPESVVQHDNQSFVFVELSQGTFQRVDVRTGHSTEQWIEITDGLKPGQLVVSNGAFLLKSELLLRGEGE